MISSEGRLTTVVRFVLIVFGLFASLVAWSTLEARAEWHLSGVVPTRAELSDVLAANARASGRNDSRLAQRRERWTYTTGTQRIAVAVAVRDDDFRTSLDLEGLTYMAGRTDGARWRADGNGIVHGVEADLQGDALDRAPQAVFALVPTACTLAGEAQIPQPAWVIKTQRPGEKTAFLYVDEGTGSIVREVMRDGKRVVTTNFDKFESLDGALRARHWRVSDGNDVDTLDVTVDAIEPGVVSANDVAFPARRVFAPSTPLVKSADLDATFTRNRVKLKVSIDGAPRWFDLDTGTTSITVDSAIGRRSGGTTLEHALLPHLSVGALSLDRVSVLNVPFWGDGILGLDFFFGHVVEIDYLRRRVRVLTAADAATVFADPKTTVIEANIDQGMPIAHAGFGAAQGDVFAIDTGSSRLYVMRPFMVRFAQEIGRHWTPAGPPYVERYLEGGIEVQPYLVDRFDFANAAARGLTVGGQVPTKRTDDLDVPFDGIIGTDILQNFDLYFDYDNERLGLRR